METNFTAEKQNNRSTVSDESLIRISELLATVDVNSVGDRITIDTQSPASSSCFQDASPSRKVLKIYIYI